MEKIFHVKKNRFSSTDETLRFIFNRFYGILNAEIIRNENGKPFLKSKETIPPLFCSVSHTDNELFIAISSKNVGLDVENTHRTVHYEPIIKRFSTLERKEIQNVQDFLKHWTSKESAIKWLGGSIANDLYKLEFIENELIYKGIRLPVQISFLPYHEYLISVCSEVDFSKIQITEIE